MYIVLALFAALFANGALYAAEQTRFITKVALPSGKTAVVAEGEYEARSIGSFSLHVYDAAPSADASTFFKVGLVCACDGAIEKVMLADVAGDEQPEIIVIVRSAGTGGYLSAHAFALEKQGLSLAASADGLQPYADPLAAMRKANTKPTIT